MNSRSAVAEGNELVPARMLNEYSYCPRLCYMQWIQREWRHSADTLEGRYVHRRVDVEAGGVPAPGEIAEGDRIHARSVLVGSERLGAIARVDVLESDGVEVTPVDYKKGSPPDRPERAWEPERVQVRIQGLLLEDNGYRCRSGMPELSAGHPRSHAARKPGHKRFIIPRSRRRHFHVYPDVAPLRLNRASARVAVGEESPRLPRRGPIETPMSISSTTRSRTSLHANLGVDLLQHVDVAVDPVADRHRLHAYLGVAPLKHEDSDGGERFKKRSPRLPRRGPIETGPPAR